MSNIGPVNPAGLFERPVRVPPHNFEAEQALLGALLVRNPVIERIADWLRPEHFAEPVHGRIYQEMLTLWEAGRPFNPISMRFSWPEKILDMTVHGYMGRLAASVVTIINGYDYARTIASCANRRRLIEIAQILEDDAYENDDAPALIEEAEAALFELGNQVDRNSRTIPLAAAARRAAEEVNAIFKSDGSGGLKTGLLDLDYRIGGLKPGQLIVIAGRPGMGKSALAFVIASNLARKGTPTAFFSQEMTSEDLAMRELAARTGIGTDRQSAARIDRDEMAMIASAAFDCENLPLFIDDKPARSLASIRRDSRRMISKHKIKAVFIDHLQLMRLGNRQDRRLEIGEITNGLKAMAKELNVPVILLSQLSRAVEGREDKRPMLSDLRESGEIEQDADIVMFLYREEYYLKKSEPRKIVGESEDKFDAKYRSWEEHITAAANVAEVIIAKQRQGIEGTVRLYFDGVRQRFENLARDER